MMWEMNIYECQLFWCEDQGPSSCGFLSIPNSNDVISSEAIGVFFLWVKLGLRLLVGKLEVLRRLCRFLQRTSRIHDSSIENHSTHTHINILISTTHQFKPQHSRSHLSTLTSWLGTPKSSAAMQIMQSPCQTPTQKEKEVFEWARKVFGRAHSSPNRQPRLV